MSTRRTFLRTTTAAGLAALAPCRAGLAGEGRGTTFLLVADTHYSSVDEDHPASHAMVKAINQGNKDGHGSFALVHATRERFDLVHVNCTAPDGTFAFRPHHHLTLRLAS